MTPSIGILIVCALLVALWLLHRNRTGHVNLDELILGDDYRISKAAVVMYTALGITSWVMVKLTIADKMSGEIFAAFIAGWVTPAVTKLIVDGGVKKAAATGNSDTNIAQQVVVTPEKT